MVQRCVALLKQKMKTCYTVKMLPIKCLKGDSCKKESLCVIFFAIIVLLKFDCTCKFKLILNNQA